MNTDMDEDELVLNRQHIHTRKRALTSTRRSSQVCSHWRQVLLQSPSIWGRVIDLDLFQWQRTGHWMEEVFRRTAESPLHIKGDPRRHKVDYLVDLLDIAWDRVCVLHVHVAVDKQQFDRISEIVSRPARSLQNFSLDVQVAERSLTDKPAFTVRLFAGEAPFLKRYHHFPVSGTSFIQCPLWLSNLHTIIFTGEISPFDFTASQLLRTIKQMLRLEVLRLHFAFPSTDYLDECNDYDRVKLPNLRHIEIFESDAWPLTKFIDAFEPEPGCGIGVLTRHGSDSIENTTRDGLVLLLKAIYRYSDSYFRLSPPNSVHIEYQPQHLIIRDTSTSKPADLRLSLDIWTTWRQQADEIAPPALTSTELASFLYPPTAEGNKNYFQGVKQLSLSSYADAETIHPSYIDLLSMLAGLENVETLSISERSLATFNSCIAKLKKIAIPFPSVRTLQFSSLTGHGDNRSGIPNLSTKLPWDPKELRSFLGWRRRLGVPIEVLDYTPCQGGHTRDLRFLEEEMQQTGLKVKWLSPGWPSMGSSVLVKEFTQFNEYVCGSGMPERLEIRCKCA
ncbi:hypothetical protein CPC08DRAFT_714515, partial [Agrocybe pediades]